MQENRSNRYLSPGNVSCTQLPVVRGRIDSAYLRRQNEACEARFTAVS
jgi:hypothetical protein